MGPIEAYICRVGCITQGSGILMTTLYGEIVTHGVDPQDQWLDLWLSAFYGFL